MNEPDFWPALEHRICREFAGTSGGRDGSVWCDGLIPEQYRIGQMEPVITGTAWICHGNDQQAWTFVMRLICKPHFVSEIDWVRHLPPDDATGWLAYDNDAKQIEIDFRSSLGESP